MKPFLFILIFLSSCGEQKDKPKEDINLRLTDESDRLTHIQSTDGLLKFSVNDKNPKIKEWMEYGKRALKAWGISNDIGTPTPTEFVSFNNSAVKSRNQRLQTISNKVIKRFKFRCGKTLSKLKVHPIELNLNDTEIIPISGTYKGIGSWYSFDGKDYSFQYINQFEEASIDIVKHQKGNKEIDSSMSFFDIHNFEPWEWNYEHIDSRPSFVTQLKPFHTGRTFSDWVLAHEFGHWIVDSIINSNGKLNTQTSLFSESLADWFMALCYTTHLENKEALEIHRRFKKEFFDADLNSYWPIAKGNIEATGPQIITNLMFAYKAIRIKIYGLSGLFIALVLTDSLNTDFLVEQTVDSILSMKGKQIKCRPKEEDPWCGRAHLTFNQDKFPQNRRPHMFTLKEFLEELTKRISIPARAKPLWKKYLENISISEY